MPVKHCIAVNCTSDSRRNKDLKFHPLPKVHAVRRMWLDLVKREGFGVKPGADIRHHVLCEKHFIDGHPTAENPLPTLFHYNTSMFNKKTPRKCKNFVVHRKVRDDLSVNGPQKNPAVKIDKLKLVKCTEDQRSRHCYPYITGEIDVLTSSTCVDRTTRHSCHDGTCSSAHEYTRFRLQDHNYMCNDFEEKYCHREKLLEHIEYLEAKCGKLEDENHRLRTENSVLKLQSKVVCEVFLSEEAQSERNVNESMQNSPLTALASKLQSISAFHDEIMFSKDVRWPDTGQETKDQE